MKERKNNLTIILSSKNFTKHFRYYLYKPGSLCVCFMDEETEAKKVQVIYPRSHK